jgi:hypothetical protein
MHGCVFVCLSCLVIKMCVYCCNFKSEVISILEFLVLICTSQNFKSIEFVLSPKYLKTAMKTTSASFSQ